MRLRSIKSIWLIFSIVIVACSPGEQSTAKPAVPNTQSAASTPAPQSAPTARMGATQLLPDFTTLVEREGPAVVNISTTQTVRNNGVPLQGLSPDDPFFEFFRRFMQPQGPREFQTQSLGSGFIISDDGYILTNAHVVANADEVTVRLTDKRQFKAKVIGSDTRTDVALIKIPAQKLPKVLLGDPSKLKVGEWVAAIGAPFGFSNSVTAGIVSATGRSLPEENYVPYIQTDVAINPGNSGGPLFNLRGEVVGINAQIYSRTGGYMGVSFAIPIDVALNVSDQLRSQGKVSRGRLGVQIQELTPELAASFGLPNTNGALIASVERGGPADKAGLQTGDVILKYDGKDVREATELPRFVAGTKPGSSVNVQVWRKGKSVNTTVVVGELEADKRAQSDNREPATAGDRLGLVVSDLTVEQRRQLNIRGGILVQEVQGVAARSGLRPGDIVLAVNNDEVSDVARFKQLLANKSTGSIALLVQRGDNTLYVPIRIK